MVLTVEPPPPNQPAGGSQHIRSPISPPSEEVEPGVAGKFKLPPHTKSPSSQRVIKRARITSPGPDTDAPFLASTTLTPQPSRQFNRRLLDELPSTLPLPTASRDVVANQLKHLESLVDSVLATVVIIQAASSQPVAVSTHTREALELLNKLVAPAPSPSSSTTTRPASQPKLGQPTMPSYAQATKDRRTSHTVDHTTTPSPAGHHSPRNRARSRSSQQQRHSAYRLIVRWADHPVPQSSDSLQDFVSNLEKRLGSHFQHDKGLALELAGANVTKSGSVIIHTKAPHTASQVLQAIRINDFLDVALAGRLIPSFSCPADYLPTVDLDVPWHGVVVHDIPAQPLMESYQGADAESLWDVVKEQIGLPGDDIRDLRVLCRDEIMEKKERLSIRIMLDDP